MEQWEKDQFFKGRIGVKEVKNTKPKESRRIGLRLRAALATELMQELAEANVQELAEISQACAFPNMRLLTGDMQEDFRELLCARLTELDTHAVQPYVVAFAAALRTFPGPQACRAWGRKLLPAIVRSLKASDAAWLEGQGAVHPRLRGVDWPPSASSDAGINKLHSLQLQACRSAQLFHSVATARQVEMDCELLDALAAPLKAAVQEYLALPEAETSETPLALLLPLEYIADLLDAQASCGVRDDSLGLLLARLLLRQFGRSSEAPASASSRRMMPADCAAVAHGLSTVAASGEEERTQIEEALQLLWQVVEPQLKTTQPHLVMMLLNAIVRGGSQELLTAPGLLQAVDELLVQKVDFNPELLGRLGI